MTSSVEPESAGEVGFRRVPVAGEQVMRFIDDPPVGAAGLKAALVDERKDAGKESDAGPTWALRPG
ncbi:MAG: hypothetical protein WDO73_05445 [Ignavibacteriota bacterium]